MVVKRVLALINQSTNCQGRENKLLILSKENETLEFLTAQKNEKVSPPLVDNISKLISYWFKK